MADHGMDRREPRQGALDGGDELHGSELVARRFAVRRHVERDGGKAALDQRRDDGGELRAVALEAMDQQDDRSLPPTPGNEAVAEIDALIGQLQEQAGGGRTWRRGFSIMRRKNGATRDGATWLAAARAAIGRGRADMPELPLSALARNWASAAVRSNEEVCAFT